jgi:hypothetical protein
MAEPLTNTQLAEWEKLVQDTKLWPAPWTARTFEIDCPCPNGEDCGESHSCEEVESPEAYPASHEDPAPESEGQCVVQISVPGLESLTRPTAEFIAAARTAVPLLLAEVRRLRALMHPGCSDFSPLWFRGRWRDWHRGHGCSLDDGHPRSPEGATEIAAGGKK